MRTTLWIPLFLAWVGLLAWGEPTEAPRGQDGRFVWSFAAELHLAPDVIHANPLFYDRLNSRLDFRYRFVSLISDLALVGDGKYEASEPFMLGRYFYMENAGVSLDFGTVSLSAGRLAHRDIVESPYSLFVSSEPLPSVVGDFTFIGGPFTYESRWIRLNTRSAYGYPERGANYKVFALRLGDFEFGFQDAAVYTDRSFDVEYFLNPLPHIFVQMITKRDETPWRETANDNSLMGIFATWSRQPLSLYAQWLVDDISLDFLIPDSLRDELGDRRIASKMAWSVGGRWELAGGTLSVHHAGATKYTFAATYDAYPYGYTYAPSSQYDLAGTSVPLGYTDNYIGYKYGENNLAFLVEYAFPWSALELTAGLEYVINGSKSPANPWHEHVNAAAAGRYTQMLDDPVLEHRVSVTAAAAWELRRWRLYMGLELGGSFNHLALEPAADGGAPIFRPQAGEHRMIYELMLGARYCITTPVGARE